MEPYLVSTGNLPRNLIYIVGLHPKARFRISPHTLEIDTGRHRCPKVPVARGMNLQNM